MESFMIFVSLILVVFFVYIFFFQDNKKKIDKKSYYLRRFLRNKDQSFKYINDIEQLVVENDGWDMKVFSDKKINFSEYLEQLKLKHQKDYSKSSYKILKKNRLSNHQKQEYTKKLIEQSEELYLMEVDLGILNKTWRKSVS